MKKHTLKVIGIIFLGVIIVSCCMNYFQGKNDNREILKYISEEIGVNVSKGEIETQNDTHGGFHGDGILFVSISFKDKSNSPNILETAKNWNKLPLSNNLAHAIYVRKITMDEKGNQIFPQVEEGYYYFRDRFENSIDEEDDSQLLKRSSCNCTIAIYDTKRNILYFCEVDT